MKQLLFLAMGGLACVSLGACGGAPDLKISRSETFFNNLASEPEILHPIRSSDAYSAVVQYHVLESLLQRNKDTYEWEPMLARKWDISPDGKTFVFELFDNLKWQDGRPLTVQDVKFSFEAFRNPEYGGIRHIPYYEKMDSAKILSKTKIQFKAKEAYFGNFQVIANMDVIPEHIYKDPKARLSKTIIGSGPYKLDRYIKGKVLVLRKNPLWQGANSPANKGKWLFPAIVFRFIQTESDILLRMEKQSLDFSSLSAESFLEKTNKPPWGKKIRKIKYRNSQPSGYSYIGFNFKKPLFQDRRVRKALALLFNRELMNKKFNNGQLELARGPWYFWSDYADPKVKGIKFDPKKATELLKSAGWGDRDKNGILEKTAKGKKTELAWTVIYSNAEMEKYFTTYQEDLKQAGIKLSLRVVDFTSLIKLIDDHSFDAVALGWSGGPIDIDPKQIWHSQSSKKGGSNFISYSQPLVDKLIDKGRAQMSKKERIKTFRKAYRLIAEDVPYIFLFNQRNNFYGRNKRVKAPADAFNYDLGMSYWSLKDGI